MPNGLLKLIGVLLLVGSIGVVSVQACTTGDPRGFSATTSPAAAATHAGGPAAGGLAAGGLAAGGSADG